MVKHPVAFLASGKHVGNVDELPFPTFGTGYGFCSRNHYRLGMRSVCYFPPRFSQFYSFSLYSGRESCSPVFSLYPQFWGFLKICVSSADFIFYLFVCLGHHCLTYVQYKLCDVLRK